MMALRREPARWPRWASRSIASSISTRTPRAIHPQAGIGSIAEPRIDYPCLPSIARHKVAMRMPDRRRWRTLTVGLAQKGPWIELMLNETGSLRLSHCPALWLHGLFDLLEVLLRRVVLTSGIASCGRMLVDQVPACGFAEELAMQLCDGSLFPQGWSKRPPAERHGGLRIDRRDLALELMVFTD